MSLHVPDKLMLQALSSAFHGVASLPTATADDSCVGQCQLEGNPLLLLELECVLITAQQVLCSRRTFASQTNDIMGSVACRSQFGELAHCNSNVI
uniref:Putative secreted protein n=1 Tax=Ixodes ricinus TaxID=34613 RepID=A0A6B0UCW4_IXORI